MTDLPVQPGTGPPSGAGNQQEKRGVVMGFVCANASAINRDAPRVSTPPIIDGVITSAEKASQLEISMSWPFPGGSLLVGLPPTPEELSGAPPPAARETSPTTARTCGNPPSTRTTIRPIIHSLTQDRNPEPDLPPGPPRSGILSWIRRTVSGPTSIATAIY